jgi:hypothetical protein
VIADYIDVLSLTRSAAPDTCATLPSALDLFAMKCAPRRAPVSTAPADVALLKALYSADLEDNLNLERSDLQGRMMQAIERS